MSIEGLISCEVYAMAWNLGRNWATCGGSSVTLLGQNQDARRRHQTNADQITDLIPTQMRASANP